MDNNINENTPDIGEIISKLTSDPNMMRQISQIAGSFKGTPEISHEEHNTHTIENHTNLFNALKPYLNAERRAMLEYIIQLFNLIKMLELSGINIGSLIPLLNTNKISEE